MRSSIMASVLWCVTSLAPALAAETVSHGPPPDWVKPVILPADDARQADAPAKVLLRSHQIRFTSDSLEAHVQSYVRLQSPQGLQALGNIVLPWKPDTDVLTVHACRVLRGERIIDLLDGQQFEVLRRENNLEYAALDGMLTAVLQPRGLEVGDVVHLSFSLKRAFPLTRAPEIMLADFSDGPLSRVEVRATWDRSAPIRWRASEDVVGAKETRNGAQTEFTWIANALEPLTQPNNVPSRFWRFPWIEFTAHRNWSDVSRLMNPLYEKAATLGADSALRDEARLIANASADTEARVEAVLRLVQDRVRYVFLGMGDGNLNPAQADVTWARRFGDCKGKSALLIALLRELDIDAEPVLVATVGGDTLPGRLPTVGAFNHVIVRARKGDRTWWLDGTASGSWRRSEMTLPNYSWGLPLDTQADSLLRMVATPAANPLLETTTHIDARAGIYTDAPFTAETRVRGGAGAMLHAQLSQGTSSQRDEILRNYWEKEYSFVKVKSVGLEFDEPSGTLLMRMQGTADMDWSGRAYTTDGMRVGIRADFSRKPGVNTDAPFLIEHPTYSIVRQTIQLPSIGAFTLKGGNHDITLAGTHYSRHSRLENGVFHGEVVIRSQVPEITAAEARAAQKQLNEMWKDRLDIEFKDYKETEADVAALRTREFTSRKDLVWRGNILLNRGDYDAALADFEAAVKADSKSADALAHRGLAHFWKRDMKLARADFDAALAIDARHAVALRGLGALLRDRGDLRGAVAKLTESLLIDPDNTFALSNRAYVYGSLDNPEAALADAAAVMKLRPGAVEMFDLHAWISTSLGKESQALETLQAMFAANPDSTAALWSASHNYARLGRHDEAVAAVDRLLAKNPDWRNYQKRAEVRDPADLAGRLADLDAALALEPSSAHLALSRAQVLSESGKARDAAAVYTAQLKSADVPTERRRLHTLRAVELLRLGDSAGARKDLAAALADGADGDTYNNFCWILASARLELSSALAACDKALTIAPSDPHYHDSRGFVLLQLRRHEEAVAAYDAALAIAPKLPASLYGRGLSRKRLCECADGDADLRAGALLDPGVRRLFAVAGLTP
jgi:tetratricopeptide (TPR) repeat protein